MREYNADIQALRGNGFGSLLFYELNSLSADDAAVMADNIAKMSKREQNELNTLLEERQKVSDELARQNTQEKVDLIESILGDSLKSLAVETYNYGAMSADEFVNGFLDTYRLKAEEMGLEVSQEQYASILGAAMSTVMSESSGAAQRQNIQVSIQPQDQTFTVQTMIDGRIVAETVTQYQNQMGFVMGQ
jgi:hypothetical protein